MPSNTAVIRELLNAALNDETLTALCYDYFRPVYNQFATGMSRPDKIQRLIAHCERHDSFGLLLEQIERLAPAQYATYAQQGRVPPPSTPSPPAPPRPATNPFFYGGAVPPALFYGRQDIVAAVVQRVGGQTAQSISIVGERRMGKSSLLAYIKARAADCFNADLNMLLISLDLTRGYCHTRRGLMRYLRRELNRVGKGTHRALDQAQRYARRFRYVLQCDLRQFFPSIDHTILRRILARKITDEDVLWLSDQILAGGNGVLDDAYTMQWFPGDDLLAAHRPRGLPIGNLTSQFWANCYLNSFDHFVKRLLGCKGYVRYVDDLLLFADSKATLWDWHRALQERLATLRLTLHPHAHPHPVATGIPFLGFVIFPDHRRIKRRKVVHYRRRLRSMLKAYHSGKLSQERLTASIRGWINHVRYGDTWGLRRAVVQPVVL